MARMVLMKDKDPLVIKKAQMEDDAIYVCRCGLSAQWPLCDSSHALARKEKEGTTYRYTRAEPDAPIEQDTTDMDTTGFDPHPRSTTEGE